MPSIAESKRKVKAELRNAPEVDHDAILASLQDEIDRHNSGSSSSKRHRRRDGSRDSSREDQSRSMKFRFKSHNSEHDRDSRKRKRKSRDEKDRHHRRRADREPNIEDAEGGGEAAAHPFPREPTKPDTEYNRQLARIRRLIENKYGNQNDQTLVYSFPDGYKLRLTPVMVKEWARHIVSCRLTFDD